MYTLKLLFYIIFIFLQDFDFSSLFLLSSLPFNRLFPIPGSKNWNPCLILSLRSNSNSSKLILKIFLSLYLYVISWRESSFLSDLKIRKIVEPARYHDFEIYKIFIKILRHSEKLRKMGLAPIESIQILKLLISAFSILNKKFPLSENNNSDSFIDILNLLIFLNVRNVFDIFTIFEALFGFNSLLYSNFFPFKENGENERMKDPNYFINKILETYQYPTILNQVWERLIQSPHNKLDLCWWLNFINNDLQNRTKVQVKIIKDFLQIFYKDTKLRETLIKNSSFDNLPNKKELEIVKSRIVTFGLEVKFDNKGKFALFNKVNKEIRFSDKDIFVLILIKSNFYIMRIPYKTPICFPFFIIANLSEVNSMYHKLILDLTRRIPNPYLHSNPIPKYKIKEMENTNFSEEEIPSFVREYWEKFIPILKVFISLLRKNTKINEFNTFYKESKDSPLVFKDWKKHFFPNIHYLNNKKFDNIQRTILNNIRIKNKKQ